MNKLKKFHMLLPLVAAAFFASSSGKAHASPAGEPVLNAVAQAMAVGVVQSALTQAVALPLGAVSSAVAMSAVVAAASVGYVAGAGPVLPQAK